jgi:hypothetical protein
MQAKLSTVPKTQQYSRNDQGKTRVDLPDLYILFNIYENTLIPRIPSGDVVSTEILVSLFLVNRRQHHQVCSKQSVPISSTQLQGLPFCGSTLRSSERVTAVLYLTQHLADTRFLENQHIEKIPFHKKADPGGKVSLVKLS